MKLKTATKILKDHNQWRKGSETIPMTEPKILTKANVLIIICIHNMIGVYKITSNRQINFTIMKNNTHKINGYIYVTNNKNPKLDEYGINTNNNVLFKDEGFADDEYSINYCRKIILTDDPNLTTIQQLTPEEVSYLNIFSDYEVEQYNSFGVDNWRYRLIQTEHPKRTIFDMAINLLKQTTEFEVLQSFRNKVNDLETANKKTIPASS